MSDTRKEYEINERTILLVRKVLEAAYKVLKEEFDPYKLITYHVWIQIPDTNEDFERLNDIFYHDTLAYKALMDELDKRFPTAWRIDDNSGQFVRLDSVAGDRVLGYVSPITRS